MTAMTMFRLRCRSAASRVEKLQPPPARDEGRQHHTVERRRRGSRRGGRRRPIGHAHNRRREGALSTALARAQVATVSFHTAPATTRRVRVVAHENRSNAATTITLQQLTLAPAPYTGAGVDDVAVVVTAAEAVVTGAARSTDSTPPLCHHTQQNVRCRQRGAHHAGAQALTTTCAQQQRLCILR